MSNPRTIEMRLATKLREKSAELTVAMPDMKPIIAAIGTLNEKNLTSLARVYRNQRNKGGPEIEVVSQLSLDGTEVIGIPEQIIFFALTNRLQMRSVMNAEQRAAALKIMAECGLYSWDWMCIQSRALIKIYSDNNGTGEKADAALAALTTVHSHLQRFYWGLGHIKVALNLSELLSVMARVNFNNQLRDKIEATQTLALERVLCAKSLLDNDYSNQIFEMFIPGKKIKNMFREDPDKEVIPDDNEVALEWLENKLRDRLLEKVVDLSRIESQASFELTKMKEVLGEITLQLLSSAEEKKEQTVVSQVTQSLFAKSNDSAIKEAVAIEQNTKSSPDSK